MDPVCKSSVYRQLLETHLQGTFMSHDTGGDSLVVQWLRLHTPNAEGLVFIPGQGTRSHMPQLRDAAYCN